MEQKKDITYRIDYSLFKKGEIQRSYNYYKKYIDSIGYYRVNTGRGSVKFYQPELITILLSTEFPLWDTEEKKDVQINCFKEYLKTYIEGFKEGEQYFEAEFKVPPDGLYSEKGEQYVSDIFPNYFDILYGNLSKGWVFVKKDNSVILTHEIIKKYGYYSGIVSKVDEMEEKHPKPFADFVKRKQEQQKIEVTPIEETKKTKAQQLKSHLIMYGFLDIDKVKILSEQGKDLLIEKIAENDLPYAIAMLDYLQFITYLEKKHFSTKDKLNIEIAKWFNVACDGRTVKGNISTLLDYSAENKTRYTAHQHKETVIKDYKLLK